MVGTQRPRAVHSLTSVTPARTIWVYRNGDPYYLGRKFVINHRYVPNFEALMIQLNEGVPTPFGVRNIYTPRQGHSVTDLPDFQQGGRYVVAGRERFRKLNYFSIGAKKPQRKKKDEVIRPVVHSNIQVPSKWQSDYKKPLTIKTGNLDGPCICRKFVWTNPRDFLDKDTSSFISAGVFTNGDLLVAPVKIIIPKFTQKSWNGVLGLINEKVLSNSGGVHRLYTLNGHPVNGSDDLEHNQFYVGCGKEKFQPLPYWQHQKVPEDTRCYAKTLSKSGDNEKGHFPSSPGTPEKPPLKKHPGEASQKQGHLKPSTGLSKYGAGDRASVYYAKSEKASREMAPEPLSSDDGGGVYKARVPPQDVKGAQEIQEDKNTKVERPVDQTPAEVVHEEDLYSNVRATPEAEDNEEGKKACIERSLEKKGIFKKMFGFIFNKPKKKGENLGNESSEYMSDTISTIAIVNGKVPSMTVVTELPQTPSVKGDANKTEGVVGSITPPEVTEGEVTPPPLVPEEERELGDQSEEQVALAHTSHPPPGENAVGDPDSDKQDDAKEGTDDYFSKEQDAKKQRKLYSPENELFDAYDYV